MSGHVGIDHSDPYDGDDFDPEHYNKCDIYFWNVCENNFSWFYFRFQLLFARFLVLNGFHNSGVFHCRHGFNKHQYFLYKSHKNAKNTSFFKIYQQQWKLENPGKLPSGVICRPSKCLYSHIINMVNVKYIIGLCLQSFMLI